MLNIEKTVLPSPEQWEIVIEGMRNPMNSWEMMDSSFSYVAEDDESKWGYTEMTLGEKDHKLMMSLNKGGTEHSKYRRMLPVWVTLSAPLYFWKEADTYAFKVQNSCSTMHKIHAKEFEYEDFSFDHVFDGKDNAVVNEILTSLNWWRDKYLEAKTKPMKEVSKRAEVMKQYWWQLIQLLPSSYNQKRTLFLNYEVLAKMYRERKNHKLDEWHTFCDWIKTLPYSELITMEE